MSKLSNILIDIENKMSDPLFCLIFNRIMENINKGISSLSIQEAYNEALIEYHEATKNS